MAELRASIFAQDTYIQKHYAEEFNGLLKDIATTISDICKLVVWFKRNVAWKGASYLLER